MSTAAVTGMPGDADCLRDISALLAETLKELFYSVFVGTTTNNNDNNNNNNNSSSSSSACHWYRID